jgi:monofunctional glycosyltransferase
MRGPYQRPACGQEARQTAGGTHGWRCSTEVHLIKSRKARIALVLVGVLGGLAAWYALIPYPWTLRDRNPSSTAVMDQRAGEARASGSRLPMRQDWVSLDEISPELIRAVLVAEDYRFHQHHGVDWVSLAEEVRWTGDDDFSWLSLSDLRALERSVAYAWTNRDHLRGRSTITQQLAKNLYFGTDRSLPRKALELVVARRLEHRLGKDRILELYLNVAELGPGLFGVEAASRTYFGHSAASLDLDEGATLAATLPSPLTSNPLHEPARMARRKDLILQHLNASPDIPLPPLPLPEPDIQVEADDLQPVLGVSQ